MSSPQPSLEDLARGDLDDVDARILTAVAALHSALDPVPAGLVERVTFGITLDALHAEIASLQRSEPLAGVRADGSTQTQTVTFTSANMTLMVTVTPQSAELARVDGWAAPGAGVEVELRLPDGVRTATADDDGRFVFDDVRRGFGQFVVRGPGSDPQTPIITPSIEI
jgi:hypothetical protein